MNQWYCFECKKMLGEKRPPSGRCPHCGSEEIDNIA